MNIIAIDCGASFIKGMLFENGNVISSDVRNTPAVNAKVWKEVTQINSIVSIVREMVLKLAGDRKDVVLCISNEMHGFLLSDESGMPYVDYISWQLEFGSRALHDCSCNALEILSDDKYADDIRNTGMNLKDGLPSVNLLYLSHEYPWKKIKGNLKFYTLGDYVLRKLSGKDPNCHATNAAATGLYDLQKSNWNQNLIQAVSGTGIAFLDVGEDTLEFDLQGIHVTALPALGDQQAALLGAGLQGSDEISFNVGTGAQASRIVSGIVFSKDYQIRPYFDGRYIMTIPHLPSGRALNVFFGFVQETAKKFNSSVSEKEIWEWILKETGNAADTGIIVDLSFFSNPITDGKTGSITNIDEKELKVGSLFKSVFMQMADNFLWAAERLSMDKKNVSKIIFSGGVAKRIEFIRSRIMGQYPVGTEYVVAQNETLHGLYRYAENNFG